MLFHSSNFWGSWNRGMQFFHYFSKQYFSLFFLIFRHSFFFNSWTAEFAEKAKRVSFKFYFMDAHASSTCTNWSTWQKFLDLRTYTPNTCGKRKQFYILYCNMKIPCTYVESTPEILISKAHNRAWRLVGIKGLIIVHQTT